MVGWIWEKHFARLLPDEASDNQPIVARVESHEFDVAETKTLDWPLFTEAMLQARKAESERMQRPQQRRRWYQFK